MLWPVTVLGTVVGSFAGGVPGALLGAVLGHALDRHWRLRRWNDLSIKLGELRGRSTRFEHVLFLCMGRLARANGRVTPAHLQLARDLMQQYRLDESARLAAMHDFNAGKSTGPELTRLVRRFCRREPSRAAELLDCCWRMALLPGQLSADASVLLDAWSSKAGVGNAEQQRMHQKHQQHQRQRSPARPPVASHDRLHQAAALLKVELDDSPEQIKRAYRRQLSKHHPDKLIARGAGEPQLSGAGEQIHRIQEAYETLRRYRGFR